MPEHTPQLPLFTTSPHDPVNEIPFGFCQCGCGQLAPIAKKNSASRGHKKGSPIRFIRNHHHNTLDYIKYFWDHLSRLNDNDCWEWQARTDDDGYGTIVIRGQRIRAHRYSYQLHYGVIPDGLWVLHRCDRRSCVNPNHLFLGTAQDNVDDMMNKGRHRVCYGESSGTSKLTDDKVLAIRERLALGEPQSSVARDFNVSQSIISDINRRVSWKHI